jgi:hypothetical protein
MRRKFLAIQCMRVKSTDFPVHNCTVFQANVRRFKCASSVHLVLVISSEEMRAPGAMRSNISIGCGYEYMSLPFSYLRPGSLRIL